MGSIKKLSQALISQIAAGEVIERPASAVRELMDNAIDAGATHIQVDIGSGGLGYIQVQDNGKGISAEDLPLAVERHATSKISSFEELTQVQTLGFRGEALASMGSVGNLTIRSRVVGAPMAYSIRVSAGVEEAVKMDPKFSNGTCIRLEHLFLHVPARRKFLKSENHELQKCKEAFIRSALSHPQVHMTFKKDGKLMYDFKTLNALVRVKDVFGAPWDEKIATVSHVHALSEGTVRVEGFVSAAKSIGTHKEMEFLFVNGRFVKDKTIAHAVKEAFLQAKGIKDGAYALWVYVPFDFVDANAHPAKVEVRFKDVRILHQLVYQALLDALGGADPTAREQAKMPKGQWASYPQQQHAQQQWNWMQTQNKLSVEEEALFANDQYVKVRESGPLKGSEGSVVNAIGLSDYGYEVITMAEGFIIIPQHRKRQLECLYHLGDDIDNGTLMSVGLNMPFVCTLSAQQKVCAQRYERILNSIGIQYQLEQQQIRVTHFPKAFVHCDLLGAIVGVLEELERSQQTWDICVHLVLSLDPSADTLGTYVLNDPGAWRDHDFLMWVHLHAQRFDGWSAKKIK